jgi:hypothetical protein
MSDGSKIQIPIDTMCYMAFLHGGMVQAWVAHFVTLLTCTYDEYD